MSNNKKQKHEKEQMINEEQTQGKLERDKKENKKNTEIKICAKHELKKENEKQSNKHGVKHIES